MALLNFLSGRSTDKTQTSQQQTTAQELSETSLAQATERDVRAGETTRGQTGVTEQRLFRPSEQAALDQLLALTGGAAGRVTDTAGTQQRLAEFLLTRAQGGIDADEISANAQRAAVAEFEQRVVPQLNVAAQAVGSEQNTTAALLRAREGSLLAERLAGIDAQTRLQVESLLNQAGAVAVEGGQAASSGRQAAINDVIRALDVAKGGTATADTQQLITEDVFTEQVTNRTEAEESLRELLQELSGAGSNVTREGSSILDFLPLLTGNRSQRA